MSLQDSTNNSAVAGEAAVICACVQGCTVIRRAARQGNYLRVSAPLAITSAQTFTSSSDRAFSGGMSIPTVRDDIGTISHSVGKESRIRRSVFDMQSSRYSTRLSTLPNYAHACRSTIITCRAMGPCTGAD